VLTVRGISDLADGDKVRVDAAGSKPLAAARAAAFAAALIYSLSPDQVGVNR